MFIVKDQRKVNAILYDETDLRMVLRLCRREAEFAPGSTAELLDAKNGPAFRNLTRLELGSNKLNDLRGFSTLAANSPKLAELNLGNNLIAALPDSLGRLVSLKTLSLESNRLHGPLPSPILRLHNLQVLRLSSNSLTSLPDTLGDLHSLTTLTLDNNALSELPAGIGRLSSLETLILRGNTLSSLPDSIGNLTKLRLLSASSNKLSRLPASLSSCAALSQLLVHSNELESLPAGLARCTNLTRVNLAFNALAELPMALVDAWEAALPERVVLAMRAAAAAASSSSDASGSDGAPAADVDLTPAALPALAIAGALEVAIDHNPIMELQAPPAAAADSESPGDAPAKRLRLTEA